MSEADVLVVGGGVAGITAALDLAEAGRQVTLVEVRPRLGGAAYSFARDELTLDNGQHVFLRCCTAYRALLARLGSESRVRLQERLEIPLLRPGAAPWLLRRDSLPAPLHLAGAIARHPELGLSDRVGVVRAALALSRLDPGESALDETSFGDWLAAHGQGPRAIAALWDLVALPTLNLPAAQASLQLAAFVFQTGLLGSPSAGDIGFHERPFGEILGDPALAALDRAGVTARLRWRAQSLGRSRGRLELEGSQEGGPETIQAMGVVLALPHTRAAGLLEPIAPGLAARAAAIASSPIVNLYLVYDRPVLRESFAAALRSPLQYVFDRTRASGLQGGGQVLAVSLSGAREEMGMSSEALRERYVPAVRELLPEAAGARLERFIVTREHAATFRAAPGVGALRPPQSTAIPGLVLAGAWTATGWPATLEGAVLSGHTAARALLANLPAARPGRPSAARDSPPPSAAPPVPQAAPRV